MKIAEESDIDTIVSMCLKFAEATGYKDMVDEDTIKALAEYYVTGDHTQRIVIMDDNGFIAGQATPFPFGDGLIASETAWWIDPEARGENKGGKLVQAFEYWAKNIAQCKFISMTSLDSTVEKLYKKNGYKLYERAYMKVL